MIRSVGIIPYRNNKEILLAHPGGPYWEHRNRWSIIKGQSEDIDRFPIDTAIREFKEETSYQLDPYDEKINYLGQFKITSKKICEVFILNKDFDPNTFVCNTCFVEYPKDSNHYIEIPENDRYAWFSLKEAENRIMEGQVEIINKLMEKLNYV